MIPKVSEAKYQEILKSVPPHDSQEFITFLIDNNRVILINEDWLVIENMKYHTPQRPWYTAFSLKKKLPSMASLMDRFGDYEWKKKQVNHQSITRFHIHLFQNGPQIHRRNRL